MNPRPYFAILASLFLALPALAQDTSQFSDEILRREQARLLSHRWSNDPGKGYDGRITSSDYEVEFQMQQMDKAREREHHARYNMIEDELRLRAQARAKAAQEREAEERQADADASQNKTKAYIAEQNRQIAESTARHQAWMRQQNDALGEHSRQAAERSASQTEQFYQRSRTPPPSPVLVPVQPPPDNTTQHPLQPYFADPY